MDRSRFVVRDLKEERSDGLSKSREVGVGRLSVDRIEVVEGVGGFCHNILRSHAVTAKMVRPSSCGSEGSGVESLGKHKEFNRNNHLYRKVPQVFWVRWLFYGCRVGGR